jgi:hypothetical protein
MSSALPSTPRRGTQKTSQLRHVSNGSSEITPIAEPVLFPSGTVQHDPILSKSSSERKCTLWIHDDLFSRDDVILNLDHFPDVKVGDLMAIVEIKTDPPLRDFPENVTAQKAEGEALSTPLPGARSNSKPNSPGGAPASSVKHDLDTGRQCLFIAKDMSKEMKARQPTMDVSVAKHMADTFHLKSRAQVLVITVRRPSFKP